MLYEVITVGDPVLGSAVAIAVVLRLMRTPVGPVRGMPPMSVLHLPVCGLPLRTFFLIGGIDPKIMLGMLVVIFRCDSVTGAGRIARQRQIFLVYLKRVPADPHAWSVAVEQLLTV